ncbi:hypothetical protein CVT26_000740 [Gymnopilus dilepis]|uniref:Uncharacterized protein n=1 Tax=Gymnopilus dilepis TaxID=231916 RepID=A0A409Y2N4_9AGAR|nr:hypothetical protein CVT26_000740 [Gymnopilus dilepis]
MTPARQLPPPGIFNWHYYLQCVAMRFATTDYKPFPNPSYHVYPFKTDDDADDDTFDLVEGDDYAEPPYPTYNLDASSRHKAGQCRCKYMRKK